MRDPILLSTLKGGRGAVILRKETVDDILDRIEALYDAGKCDRARKELRRARRLYPDDLTLLEWEATFSNDEGRYADGLAVLDDVLGADPGRPFARREKVAALMGLGRFGEALKFLEEIGPDNAGDAGHFRDRALCLDRLDRAEEADRAFKKAARLDPEEYRMPPRLSQEEFEDVVREALDELPEDVARYLDNVIVQAVDYPRSPPLDPGIDPCLLGLYLGVPRTDRSPEVRDNLDRIFVFKRNLEIEFPDLEVLKEEIRKTVIHEIAHHFGFGEDEMGGFE
jgi:predicted Zn-dependent protease with MMP-like domain